MNDNELLVLTRRKQTGNMPHVSGGESLLSGRFNDALLVRREGGYRAEFSRRDDEGDSSVQFTVGPGLASLAGCIAPQRLHIALWGLRFNHGHQAASIDKKGFTDQIFSANGSFFASAVVIPEPTSFLFAVLGSMGMIELRPRSH